MRSGRRPTQPRRSCRGFHQRLLDDTSANVSPMAPQAPARSSGEGERSSEGERRGIIQIFANTLVKLKPKDATIDQPNAADTIIHRGMAAIGYLFRAAAMWRSKWRAITPLNGYGNSAGIQKTMMSGTGKLTTWQKTKIRPQRDRRCPWCCHWRRWMGLERIATSTMAPKNIEINGGTVNTQGRIGSGYNGGAG